LVIKREEGRLYSFLREQWLVETPEEAVRQEFVCTLFNEFGYPLEVMKEEYKADYNGRGVRSTRADIVIYKSKQDKEKDYNAFIIVECKAETVRIKIEDFYQGTEYAAKTRAQFLILHNIKETNYYAVDKEKIPNKEDAFNQIITIPKYTEVNNQKAIDEIKSKTKVFTREEFTKTLRACHNIIRNNDKLSPEAAFDEISKILFMKIKYEREAKGEKVFTKEQFEEEDARHEKEYRPILKGTPKDLPYMQWMFENTKQFYAEDQLFEESEIIKIRQNSFEQILEKLQTYNLSDTQDDVKGIAFEQFLGTTFRGELGQFFTPRTIVDFMTNILDPAEGELICDPTCGSGGFLIKAFEYIREKIEKDVKKAKDALRIQIEGINYDSKTEKEQIEINQRIDYMQATLNKELESQTKGSRLYSLSHNCIYGTDANPRMARTSKMNMIMHGDGHGGVHHHDGLLNVNGIFENRFDVILTNPPFGARIDASQKITETDRFSDAKLISKYRELYGDAYDDALCQVNKNIGKSLLSLYEVGSGLTEVLFMERCIKLLKKGGRMGIVLPEGVLNTSGLQKVREFFEGKAKIILICSIPQDVFIAAGATVKPSLVFFKRFTETEERQYALVKINAYREALEPYEKEHATLLLENEQLSDIGKSRTSRAREIRNRIAEIEETAYEKSKLLIKTYYDYEIPIALVNDGGITSTGAKTDNKELMQLLNEYKDYKSKKILWEVLNKNYNYTINKDKVFRNSEGQEVELPWQK
jgi:type I restriction enzyme M protein